MFKFKNDQFSKCVAVIVIGIIINTIITSVNMLVIKKENSNLADDTELKDDCLTPECHIDRLRAGFSILSYMNGSISPCEDFYDFVCGNYKTISDINNDKPYTFIRKSNKEFVAKYLYESIKKINASSEEFRHRKLVKEFFDMCMDTDTIEDRGIQSLKEILETLGGWPVLEGDKWNEEEWNWENVYNTAIKLGVPTESFLLNIDVHENRHNTSMSMLLLSPPQLEFPHQRMQSEDEDNKVKAYRNFMVDIAVNGFQVDRSRAEIELMDVFDFEKKLTKYSKNSYYETNLTRIGKDLPRIDWNTLFNLSAYGIIIEETEPILVKNKYYVKFLRKMKTSKRLLANFQIWKFIQYAIPYLNSEFREIKNNYKAESTRRWKTCIEDTRNSLPHITDAIFIQDYLNKDIRDEILEIIEETKLQVIKILNSMRWLDESARKWVLRKLNSTEYLVAYPDEAFDNELLDKMYEGYELVDEDYLKTVLRFNYLSQKRKMIDYKTFNRTSYEALSSWIDSNAYNYRNKNTIQILAGKLQDQTYNKNRPKFMNYATIGKTIGHEMSHSFDRSGIKFDGDGNRFHPQMEESVRSNYDIASDCLRDQYSHYKFKRINKTIGTFKVDGALTLNENIADVNGIRIAYYAYQDWVKSNGPESNLQHVPFTANQLFWISYAHSTCRYDKIDTIIDKSYSVHATNDVRIRGAVSNSPEFAADFNCPVDSQMNPKNKCTFW